MSKLLRAQSTSTAAASFLRSFLTLTELFTIIAKQRLQSPIILFIPEVLRGWLRAEPCCAGLFTKPRRQLLPCCLYSAIVLLKCNLKCGAILLAINKRRKCCFLICVSLLDGFRQIHMKLHIFMYLGQMFI